MGGFFTMQHLVTDATPALGDVWGDVDAQCLQQLLLTSVPTLAHHWKQSLRMFDSRSPARRAPQAVLVRN